MSTHRPSEVRKVTESGVTERLRKGLVLFLAFFSAVAPLKFTQPVVLYRLTYWPKGLLEWVFCAWPNAPADGTLMALLLPLGWVAATLGSRRLRRSSWFFIPPVLFLASQALATLVSVHLTTSLHVMALFVSLAILYGLGGLLVRDARDLRWIATGWLVGAVFVVISGISQATGGLEETRQFLNAHPEMASAQPGLWEKIQSDRIFATFVYPNALGGYVAAAVFLIAAWGVSGRSGAQREKRRGLEWVNWRIVVALGMALALVFCLWKSLSKGGYAIFGICLVMAIFALTPRRRIAVFLSTGMLILLVAGFALGYGRPAVEKARRTFGARLDYWEAAWQIGRDRPLLGCGPGGFSVLYPTYKEWDAESTRLVHNNYLQMWCDSGIIGFVTFILWLPTGLILWWRTHRRTLPGERVATTLIWMGCVAFALHSLVDFDLYMLSNSGPIFILLGYFSMSGVSETVGLELREA